MSNTTPKTIMPAYPLGTPSAEPAGPQPQKPPEPPGEADERDDEGPNADVELRPPDDS